MTNMYDENYVGNAALQKGLITPEQLEECKGFRQKSTPPKSLARVLFEKGYISDEQLGEILRDYKASIGEALPEDSDPGSIGFGEAVVQRGLAKNVDIWEAIEEQAGRSVQGAEGRLGQILVERGTLEITQAKEILESQGKMILKCAECGHQYNVKEFNATKEYTCLNCGGPLSAPEAVSSLDVQGTAVDSQTVKQSMDDKFVGTEIGGCEILEKLGEGGMGAVYKARHITLNKIVAVKVMSSALMGEIHRKRFLREARAAAQLEHVNIIQVHDTGVAEGFNYIVMQFIDGESIQRMLTREGKFEQKEALRVIKDAADALGFAHKRHMIHRDIKPDNIMLTSDRTVKVADFGLVKSTEIEKDLTGMSQSMLMGTPHYMSPEQFEGKIIDHRTDIYSLGVTLYYMLTGHKPYDGTTPYQIMQGHLQQEFVDPTNLSEEIYPAVSQLVRKMMARDREQRYQNCDEITSDINRIMGGFEDGTIATEDFIIVEDDELGPTMQADVPEVVGKKTPPVPPGAEEKPKKSALVILVPIAIIAVLAAVLAFVFLGGKNNGEKPDEPKPAVSSKDAEIAFEATKMDADKLADEDRFAEAMAKWEGFVPKWGKDPWQDKVDVQRALILKRALERLNELLASDRKEDIENALKEARALHKLQPNAELQAIITAADQKLKGMESSEETLARKLKEFEEADGRAQVLKNEGKLKAARDIYDPEYVGSEVEQIKQKAGERVAEIDTLLAAKDQQWTEYRTAEEQAKALLEVQRYGEAKAKYVPFTGSGYMAEIREDALAKIEKIEGDWGKYNKTQFDVSMTAAQEYFVKERYAEARKALEPYVNHPEEEFSKPAAELDQKIRTYQDLITEMAEVDRLRDAHRYDQALVIARRYAQSTNKDFSDKGSAKVKLILTERYKRINLVYAEGGKIPVGSNDPADRNESRTVDVKPFYMDRTEVTNAQYREFVRETGHGAPLNWTHGRPPAGKENHPVTRVTHEDAKAFCEWRSKKEGATYRLPTESEWEYAASYDPGKKKKFVYPWGDEFDKSLANLSSGTTQEVASNKDDKSPLGICDMAGNVAEWTITDDGGKYIIRGGSMKDAGSSQTARTSYRHKTEITRGAAGVGFRCVREE